VARRRISLHRRGVRTADLSRRLFELVSLVPLLCSLWNPRESLRGYERLSAGKLRRDKRQ